MSPPVHTLRSATAADHDVLVDVFLHTRAAWLVELGLPDAQVQLMLGQQYEAYRRQLDGLADATDDVVELDGAPAGRLVVDRTGGRLHLVEIGLRPQARGRGVGTALLDALIVESTATGTTLTLRVEPENPARRLYARLGFTQPASAEQTGDPMIWLERAPGLRPT